MVQNRLMTVMYKVGILAAADYHFETQYLPQAGNWNFDKWQ